MTALKIYPESMVWDGKPWLWAAGDVPENAYVELRCRFQLEGEASAAWLAFSADTTAVLYVNGTWVHHGPPREAPPYFYYDPLDLSGLLHEGENELRLLAHHCGVNHGSHVASFAGVLVQGEISVHGRKLVDLGEPSVWEARPATAFSADTHRLHGCLGFAEIVDLGAEAAEWTSAEVVGQHPLEPLTKPLRRDLSLFSGDTFTAHAIEGGEQGTLLDFGQEVFGFVELELEAAEEATVQVRYAERLYDGRVAVAREGDDYRDVLKVPEGWHQWHSFEKRAFRYCHLDAGVRVREMRVREYRWPLERAEQVEGNRFLEVSARTIELCSDDLLNDCPWRERSQYLDPFFVFAATHQLFGTWEPARRYLKQFARGSRQGGKLPMNYPSAPGNTVIPDFCFLFAHALDRYREWTGDLETVKSCFVPAVRAVEDFRNSEDAHGMLEHPGGWVFLDNTFELAKEPASAGLNAAYAGAWRALSNLAGALGETFDAKLFDLKANQTRQVFREVFLRDGQLLDTPDAREEEPWRYWNYHHSAFTGCWKGEWFRLKSRVRFPDAGKILLRFAHCASLTVKIDGTRIFSRESGGGWKQPPLFNPREVLIDATGDWQDIELEVGFSDIDWEVYFGAKEVIEVAETTVEDDSGFSGAAEWRPYSVPRRSQQTAGYACYHGMLEDDEAREVLRACLPEAYYSPWIKRTTPVFVQETTDADLLRDRVLPCNTPASLYFFAQALRRYGMEAEAKSYLETIYQAMLDHGATTWWEEFRDRSSLCHQWASFMAEFF